MEADADVSASFRHLSASPREIRAVKFVAERPLVDPDAAARKLVEIANATEAVQDGRLYIELINSAFVAAGGSPAGYPRRRAGGIDLASVPHDGGDECYKAATSAPNVSASSVQGCPHLVPCVATARGRVEARRCRADKGEETKIHF
jgi:hypothetical protein